MSKGSNKYYTNFIYEVEKKLTVADYPKIKDYAVKGIYFYIIHDLQDNNRFLYFSSYHIEEKTKINPYSFKLSPITSKSESIFLKFKTSSFGIKYFNLVEESKGDFKIIIDEIIRGKTKDNKIFNKYKTHTKKIAIDYPDFYIKDIKQNGTSSHKKKVLKLLLCNNKYNQQIINHCISTLFILYNSDYQKFNDNTIVLDEGKTGKSSLIGYLGVKVDNVSVAGLYGSSDGLRGKFKGGILTTTKKSILIDEVNELVANSKHDKILSILNSILENGVYNYVKQFGQKIYSSSQFFFMGNISDEFNFINFLEGTFGNVQTLGRRIGIVTYNNNLNGFIKGDIRENKINSYLESVQTYLSNLFNSILCNKKFIQKLYKHKEYNKLSQYYETKLYDIYKNCDDAITSNFLKSHSKSIDRVITRALKLWLFNNLDDFINNKKEYNNHTIFEILQVTKPLLDENILNFKNIVEHITNYNIQDKTKELNKLRYNNENKTIQAIIKAFHENKDKITIKGIKYKELSNVGYLKYINRDYIKRGIPKNSNMTLQQYGVNISIINNSLTFRITNKVLFERKTLGIFEYTPKPQSEEEVLNEIEEDII